MSEAYESPASPGPSVLPYAIAALRPSARLWGVALLLLSGLGSVALGGCFLIGVLLTFHPDVAFGVQTPSGAPHSLSTGETIFITVLYAAALVSVFFGVFLMLLGVKGALRIVEGRS